MVQTGNPRWLPWPHLESLFCSSSPELKSRYLLIKNSLNHSYWKYKMAALASILKTILKYTSLMERPIELKLDRKYRDDLLIWLKISDGHHGCHLENLFSTERPVDSKYHWKYQADLFRLPVQPRGKKWSHPGITCLVLRWAIQGFLRPLVMLKFCVPTPPRYVISRSRSWQEFYVKGLC